MVYMPADVLGWRPVLQSWLDKYLAKHAAARAADAAGKGTVDVLSAEPSQVESPSSPTLPGFSGKIGLNSFNAAKAPGAGACAPEGGSLQCPEQLKQLRGLIWGLFDQHAQPLLEWVLTKGRLMMPMSDAALMASVATLLEIQLDTLTQ